MTNLPKLLSFEKRMTVKIDDYVVKFIPGHIFDTVKVYKRTAKKFIPYRLIKTYTYQIIGLELSTKNNLNTTDEDFFVNLSKHIIRYTEETIEKNNAYNSILNQQICYVNKYNKFS